MKTRNIKKPVLITLDCLDTKVKQSMKDRYGYSTWVQYTDQNYNGKNTYTSGIIPNTVIERCYVPLGVYDSRNKQYYILR